jgi:hypothetical protein
MRQRRIPVLLKALVVALGWLAAGNTLAGQTAFWQLSYEYQNSPPPLGSEASYGETISDFASDRSLTAVVARTHPWGNFSADLAANLPAWTQSGLLQAGVLLSGVIGGVATCNTMYYCGRAHRPWTAARARAYTAAAVTGTLTVTGALAASTALVFHWSLDGKLSQKYLSDPPNVRIGNGTMEVNLDLIDINAYLAGDLTMKYRAAAAGLPTTFQRIHREHMFVSDDGLMSYTPEQTQGLEFLPDATVRFGLDDWIFANERAIDTTGRLVNAMIR